MKKQVEIKQGNRFTIRRRIYISFMVLIGIFAFNGFVTWRVLEQNMEITQRVFEVSNPTLQALDRFQLLITESKMLSTNWVFLPAKSSDKQFLIEIHEARYPALKNKLVELSERWDSKVPRDSLFVLFREFESVLKEERKMMERLGTFDDYEEAATKMEAELMLEDDIIPRSHLLLSQINRLIAIQRAEISIDEDRLLKSSKALRSMVIWLSLALITLSIFLAWYMGNFIARPIIAIKDLINKLGKGIIDEIPERKEEDEIKDMISSVNDLSQSLRHTAEFAEEIGKGNFLMTFTPLSDNDTLGKSLVSMRENLRKSEALLQEAQELTHNGSWEFEIGTGQIWFSDESYRILGLKKGVDKADVQAYLSVIHPDDVVRHTAFIKRAIEKGVAQNYDVRISRKDGTIKFLQIIVKPVFDEAGVVVKLFGTILDIDERKNFEADLIKAKEAAEQADRTKSLFLSNMSHEIRTPMNAIIGLSDLLIEDEVNPIQKQRLKSIRQSGDILLKIINEILDFSKIQAGKLMIENLDFNLRDVIHDASVAMSFTATSKGLNFQVETDDTLPYGVTGDPFRLNQILLNLLGNAIKFTEKGFVKLAVRLENNDGNYAQILFSVSDSGIGIPAEQHEKIFESFNQANIGHTRKYGGTGLGLTITRQLIELQGGKLMLESEQGKGSQFSFRLRYKLSATDPVQQSEQDITSGKGLAGLKVLIVEDNLTNQFVAGQILQRWKMDFAFAENGRQALDVLRKDDFELVLMDLQMPEMDGYEATIKIRSGKSGVRQTGIPIIAISADAFTQTKEKALAAGMNAFVSKPIDMSALYDAISRNIIHHHPQKQENPNTMIQETPDLSYLLNLSGNNRDFVKEILQLTLKEMPKDATNLKQQSDVADWASASKVAHKMKSSAANLGLHELKDLLLNIEKSGKEAKETEKIPVMVNEVLLRLQSVYAWLQDYIAR